ncbi:MAG: hypothetical protein J6Z36_00210 [Clostridia bacterium]|nr:hypothetical protein [Clostridia bacterium]
MEEKANKAVEAALKKVAFGFSVEEVTEEYSVEDGEVKLVKRRETRKDVPPDLKAVKMLLESGERPLTDMTDEELEKEKRRLLQLLKEENETI